MSPGHLSDFILAGSGRVQRQEMVHRQAAGTGEAEAERDGTEQQRKLIAALAIEAVFPVRLVAGDAHVERDRQGSGPREKASGQGEAADKLGQTGGGGGGLRI